MSGITAPRTYHPGDVIYKERAFVQVLFKPEACETCHSRSANLKSCTRCQKVKYCSKECQRDDWKDHKLECEHLNNLTEEFDRYFVRLLGKVILKIKNRDWRSFQRQILNTTVTFDDIGSYDTEREGNVKGILFRKKMKELTRRYIGEQNMPAEEDFYKIIGKVLLCNVVGTSYAPPQAGFFFFGLSKFGEECIPNANLSVFKDVLTVWACKEIRKGSDKITVKKLDRIPGVFNQNVDTMNNKCKCRDCSLPYGESVLSKIVDETRALDVISESEFFLNRIHFLRDFSFHDCARQVEELLSKQEEVLGDTHILHLRLLRLLCFKPEDFDVRPDKLKEYLNKYEERTRKVFGEYSQELQPIYQKFVDFCAKLEDSSEALRYMKKFVDVSAARRD